jgi:hypothetical protein
MPLAEKKARSEVWPLRGGQGAKHTKYLKIIKGKKKMVRSKPSQESFETLLDAFRGLAPKPSLSPLSGGSTYELCAPPKTTSELTVTIPRSLS